MNKEEVLKKFEKLGYVIEESESHIEMFNERYDVHLVINLDEKCYDKFDNFGEYCSASTTIQEHRLLHQLFYALGWLNYE